MLTPRHAVLAALAVAIALPTASSAANVWTALASEKLRPDVAPRATRTASLAAAKNEFEAVQVVVTGPASRVTVEVSPLTGPGTIGGVKLFREELINLATPSAADGGTGRYPDALVPDVDEVVGEKRNAFPFDVPAGESRAVWVEVHVPADATAGVYTGTITVHAADGDAAVPVTLTVWDFALPSTSSLKTAFSMTYGGLPAAHGVSGAALTALRQRYARFVLDHRVTVSNLWDDGDQKDWGHFDASWAPFLDGTAGTVLAGARVTSLQAGANLSSTAEHSDWASHFKARGWFDRLFQYTCDEPPLTCQWSDIVPRTQAAKAADPGFRTLVTTDIDQAQQHGVEGAIDVMVPVVNFMEDRSTSTALAGPGGELFPRYAPFQAAGPQKELWLYQSCMSHGCGGSVDIGNPTSADRYWTGWPSYVIDASSVRARAMEWYSFRYGATGELYYEILEKFASGDPWTDQRVFNGNGDGTLLYPGTTSRIGGQTDIPVSSIRLKMIREGMEDYEYLKLLSDLGGAAEAKQIAAQLFPHAWTADARPEDLMAARVTLAGKILARSGKSAPPTTSAAPAVAVAVASAQGSSGTSLSRASATGGGCGTATNAETLLVMLLPGALVWLRSRRARTIHP